MESRLFIGTAGWSLPRVVQPRMPEGDSHLERYAAVFRGAEINASFHRPVRQALYEKWAASVPDAFRFSVKLSKTITHERRLVDCEEPLAEFLDNAEGGLGGKLGCLLIQLPPSFAFDASLVGAFLEPLRAIHGGPVVFEPRHLTWFDGAADRLLTEYDIARAAADPAICAVATRPGASTRIGYFRLHGSPRVYWSNYDAAFIDTLGVQVEACLHSHDAVWCIFDNTASGAALPNALELSAALHRTKAL